MSFFERLDSVDTDKYHRRSIFICIGITVFVVATIATAIGIYASGVRKADPDAEDVIVNDNNSSYGHGKSPPNPKPTTNILFITLDDLRPTLGCYGDNFSITPNIDQLAEQGYIFKNAFAQQALCAPSRTSFLTSRRPDSLHLYETNSYWRDTVGNFTTLPQYLKENGYHSISIGKIFHHGKVSGGTDDYPFSWSEVPYHPSTVKYKMDKVCPSSDGELHMNLVCPVTVSEQPEKTLPDLQNLEEAIRFLRGYASKIKDGNSTSPFFLGVGFYKPHIPLKFPKEFLDLYPLEKVQLAPNRLKPVKLPDVAWNPWMDIRERDDVAQLKIDFPYGPIPDSFQKSIRQGYYASVSYVDDLIGQLLQALEETGFSNNTVIVLLGDHGWSLGEHQEWAKYSNFGVATNVPLIVVLPMQAPMPYIPLLNNTDSLVQVQAKMYSVHQLVELVDLFPTLSELVGLPVPPLCTENKSNHVLCSEGTSFVPLLNKPDTRNWKSAVFSQYPRPSLMPQNNSDQPSLSDIRIMGYSMKTTAYRYTEWVEFNSTDFVVNWNSVYSRELYIHDTDESEDENRANDTEYKDLIQSLSKQLRNGWRPAQVSV